MNAYKMNGQLVKNRTTIVVNCPSPLKIIIIIKPLNKLPYKITLSRNRQIDRSITDAHIIIISFNK